MVEKKDNNAVDKLFSDALKETIESTIEETNTVEIVQETLSIEQKAFEATVLNTTDNWALMKDKINGDYTAKAMEIMDTLGDAQFLTVYFKMMEYVNPKLVRKEKLEGKTEHKKIEITITKRSENGKVETKSI